MTKISVLNFRPVKNHPYMLALADLEINKITLRGLRLEHRGGGQYALGFPGRKIQGQWQVLYQTDDRAIQSQLLEKLLCEYNCSLGKAA